MHDHRAPEDVALRIAAERDVRHVHIDVRDAIASILDRMTLEQITQAGWADDEWLAAEWMDVPEGPSSQVW